METIIEFTPEAISATHCIICGMDIDSKMFNMIVFDREDNAKIAFEEEKMSFDAFKSEYLNFSEDAEVMAKFNYLFANDNSRLAI